MIPGDGLSDPASHKIGPAIQKDQDTSPAQVARYVDAVTCERRPGPPRAIREALCVFRGDPLMRAVVRDHPE
jgi:hypothetical protein